MINIKVYKIMVYPICLAILLSFSSCAHLTCFANKAPCKKIKFIDKFGRPIKGVSNGVGDPTAPAIMNSSDSNGNFILRKGWPYPSDNLIPFGAAGYENYSMTYDKIPDVVILEKNDD